ITVVPFLEHLHEEAVRFFVAAVLEFTDLHLVDALAYHRLERDGRRRVLGGLAGTQGLRRHEQFGAAFDEFLAERAALLDAQFGQFRAGKGRVESACHVRHRLAVPGQDQSAAHRQSSPRRSRFSHCASSSSETGGTPCSETAGHEPRNRTCTKRWSPCNASATSGSSMCPTQSKWKK